VPPVTPFAIAIVRSCLGAFLLTAAVTKLLDYSDARATLAVHIGFRRARRLTPVLIAFEAAIAFLLFVRPVATAAALAAGVLCLGFTWFTIHLARASERPLSCGCFGLAIPSRSGAFSIVRNALLAVAAFALAAAPSEHLELVVRLNAVAAGVAFSLVLVGLGALDAIRAARAVYLPATERR
jgi:methylamine utilization protein MauE